jgi:hypothetical protein
MTIHQHLVKDLPDDWEKSCSDCKCDFKTRLSNKRRDGKDNREYLFSIEVTATWQYAVALQHS